MPYPAGQGAVTLQITPYPRSSTAGEDAAVIHGWCLVRSLTLGRLPLYTSLRVLQS